MIRVSAWQIFDDLADVAQARQAAWRARAACLGAGTRLFFPEHGNSAEQARRICAGLRHLGRHQPQPAPGRTATPTPPESVVIRLDGKITCPECGGDLHLGDWGADDRQLLCVVTCARCRRRYTLHARLVPLSTPADAGPREKVCPTCGQARPHDAFTVNRARPDGLHGECRACNNNRRNSRRRQLKETA